MTDRPSTPEYFSHASVARRYARNRPDAIHQLVLAQLQTLREGALFEHALDVACGTGHSTVPLAALAHDVVGIDRSEDMLAEAETHDRVTYRIGDAEQLDFDNNTFDLVAVALAFHWFDRERFLSEVTRVLSPQGWFVIYTNGMTGQMLGNADFAPWFRTVYLDRYPGTPRNSSPLSESAFTERGLDTITKASYRADVPMSLDQIVGFLLSQSNVIARVELGDESIDSARAWITDSLQKVVGCDAAALEFTGSAHFLQRS